MSAPTEMLADAQMSHGGVLIPASQVARLLAAGPIEWPLEMRFGGPLDRGLRFKNALPVQVRKDDATYVVDCQLIEQFGYGANLSEALDDFGKTIAEMYLSLSDESKEGRLVDSLLHRFAVLQGFVEPRQAGA